MKKMHFVSLFFAIIAFVSGVQAQLANSYPNDVGIEFDTNVLYVEKFDDGIINILSRYSDIQNSAGISLDTDIPSGSLGPNSIKMTSEQGVNVGSHLYTKFTPGFNNKVYIRYYVNYPSISTGFFHHEGIWIGGYNPATNWPNPQAGTCGLGSSRLSIAYEPVWQNINPPGMDTYLYWGDMQSWNGGSSCYGNTMVTEGRTDYENPASPTAPIVAFDQWMCIEVMVKLNNPVTDYNGELAVWQNGVQVGHWGPGFPNGHWGIDKWYNDPNDPPFQGFRWRTDSTLDINWLWLEFYHDDPNAPSSYIKYDHVVMATEYIGPIYNEILDVIINPDDSSTIQVYPNPSSGVFSVKGLALNSELTVYNILGEKVFLHRPSDTFLTIDLSGYSKGVYSIIIDDKTKNYTCRKIVVH